MLQPEVQWHVSPLHIHMHVWSVLILAMFYLMRVQLFLIRLRGRSIDIADRKGGRGFAKSIATELSPDVDHLFACQWRNN